MSRLVFLDTETTGLDPDIHEVWEVGAIIREDGQENTHHWFLPVDLGRADPVALKIGRYHERHPRGYDYFRPWSPRVVDSYGLVTPRDFAEKFANLTRGSHLVGAVVSFDEERLRRLLRNNGSCPEWHYHIVTVEALAAGYKAGRNHFFEARAVHPPWTSQQLSESIGVEPPTEAERHTALGDARWVQRMYDKVMGT